MMKKITRIVDLMLLAAICALSPATVQAVDVIVDNADASGVNLLPNASAWAVSTNMAGYHGANYLHDLNAGQGTKSARFTPVIPAAGIYEVFTRWVAYTNRADNVPVDIVTAGGTVPVQVNQKLNGSAWVSLGQYPFHAGTAGHVLISNTGTNGYVIADAVKFSTVSSLPGPWQQQDVGSSNPPGSASHSGGVFSAINGAGGFHYIYQPISGNCTLTARLASLANPSDPWAKAGVAIRESLAANAKQAMMIVSRSNGLRFEYKTTTGGTHVSTGASTGAAPYWVRVVRSGNTFTAYRSSDGLNWTQSASTAITMASTVYVGLPLYGTSTATFDNVAVLGSVVPGDTTAPSVPTGLGATAVSSSQINLNWTASTDTGGSGLAGYRIYRNGSATPTATSATNSFSDTGLAASTASTYRVAAYDNAGNESALSAQAGATTLPAGSTAFFADDFSSGDFSHSAGGFSWGGPSNCQVISGFSPQGNVGNCVRFNFGIGQGGISELRFFTGGNYQQIWMRWYQYMPSGTENPARGPAMLGSSINGNKFFRLYALPESNYPRYGASWYGTTGTDVQIGPQAGIFPNGQGTVSEVGTRFNFLNAANRGRWVKVEVRAKNSTSATTPNGEIQFWIDNVNQGTTTGLNSFMPGNTGFNGGYLMGAVDTLWDNPGTYTYVGDFAISSQGRP